jgi:uncharacterized membrane protein YdfJ with MMPL/SSD domain
MRMQRSRLSLAGMSRDTSTTRNVAASMGRWSAQHRKKAFFGWLAFVVVAVVLGGITGTKTLDDEDQGVGDSQKADKVLAQAFPQEAADESVLVQSTNGARTGDPEFRAAVRDAIATISRETGVQEVEDPYRTDGAISADGRSALINFEIAGDDEQAEERVGPVLDAVATVDKRHPDLRVEQFGDASAEKAISEAFE